MDAARESRADLHSFGVRLRGLRAASIDLYRHATRDALAVLSGMSHEERRAYRRERTRAIEAARRTEGVLLARWGVA